MVDSVALEGPVKSVALEEEGVEVGRARAPALRRVMRMVWSCMFSLGSLVR